MAKTPTSLFFPAVINETPPTKILSQAVISTGYPCPVFNFLAATPPDLFFSAIKEDNPRRPDYRVPIAATSGVTWVSNYQMAATPTTMFFPAIKEETPRVKVLNPPVIATTQPVIALNYQTAATPTRGVGINLQDDRPMRADIIGIALKASASPIWPQAPPPTVALNPSTIYLTNPYNLMPDWLW